MQAGDIDCMVSNSVRGLKNEWVFANLDENIGKKSAFTLSKKFSSIEELKQADIETLTNIDETT